MVRLILISSFLHRNPHLKRVTLFLKDFRGDVVGCSAKGALSFPVIVDLCGQSKVTQFDLHVVVEENVSQLQITVDYFVVMQILHTNQHLLEIVPAQWNGLCFAS